MSPSPSPSPSLSLRHLSTILPLPAFPFLIASGIQGDIYLTFGIIPCVFSIITGLIHIRSADLKSLSTHAAFFTDAGIGFAYLAILLAFWILSGKWYDSRVLVMESYGSAFLMINWVIHWYFAFLHLRDLEWNPFAVECPDCRRARLALEGEEGEALVPHSHDDGQEERDVESDAAMPPRYSLLGEGEAGHVVLK